MCPHCKNFKVRKKGFYTKRNGRRVARFYCKGCARTFSTQTATMSCGEQKPHINQFLFRLFSKGVSQRACAEIVGIHRITVARKLVRYGAEARRGRRAFEPSPGAKRVIVFDEMESFEHSKCKPLSIALAVDEQTREILSVQVSSMPAKGMLAAIARKKYGYRPDKRARGLHQMMLELKKNYPRPELLKSDSCPRYPSKVKNHFPNVPHQTFISRRACVVGQGELKKGGFDPLFSLNHSCAMFRDNIKRLSRKTWCTTKDRNRLQDLVDIYAHYHNEKIRGVKRLVRV
jgi:transposase-like protein